MFDSGQSTPEHNGGRISHKQRRTFVSTVGHLEGKSGRFACSPGNLEIRARFPFYFMFLVSLALDLK